jgi:hypothetical protein
MQSSSKVNEVQIFAIFVFAIAYADEDQCARWVEGS